MSIAQLIIISKQDKIEYLSYYFKLTIGILFSSESSIEIQRLYRCLRRQLDKNFYLIIIIEPSQNNLEDIMCFRNLHNVKFIFNSKREGTVANRNRIVHECVTDYLGFIDGDDFVDRNYISEINRRIISNSHVYYFNYYLVNQKHKIKVEFDNLDIIKKSIEDWKILGCSVYDVSVIRKLGGYRDIGLEDFDLMLKIINSGFVNFEFVPKVWYYWIKKESGRNSNVNSLDYAIIMYDNIRLFKHFLSTKNLYAKYDNVINIFRTQNDFLSVIKIVIKGNLFYHWAKKILKHKDLN